MKKVVLAESERPLCPLYYDLTLKKYRTSASFRTLSTNFDCRGRDNPR